MNIGEAENTESLENITVSDISVDAIGEAYGEANKKLVAFVSRNIELMRAHLLSSKMPTLEDVNRAYFDCMPVALSLNDLYQKVRMDEKKAIAEYNSFDDQAMDAIKRELNREDNKKTWYSATELKAAAHTKYKNTYAALDAKVSLAEGRRSFVERLAKSWDSWQFSLGQISRNLIAEAHASGLDFKAQNYLPPDPDDTGMSLAEQAMQAAEGVI